MHFCEPLQPVHLFMLLNCTHDTLSQWNMRGVSGCLWWLACVEQIESFQSAPVITTTNTRHSGAQWRRDACDARVRGTNRACWLACNSHALTVRACVRAPSTCARRACDHVGHVLYRIAHYVFVRCHIDLALLNYVYFVIYK